MRYILLTVLESTLTLEEAQEACAEFGCSAKNIDGFIFAVADNIEHLINMAFVCDLHGEIIEVKSTTKV